MQMEHTIKQNSVIYYITDMTENRNGDLYIAELFNNTIRKIKRN